MNVCPDVRAVSSHFCHKFSAQEKLRLKEGKVRVTSATVEERDCRRILCSRT